MMRIISLAILIVVCTCTKIDITVPAGVPHPREDMYFCKAHKAPETISHVVHFQPKQANYVNGAVHHMLVYGCDTPFQSRGSWDCEYKPVCSGESFLMYAWAKKAPGLQMPKDSGFVVGGDTKFKYFVVQQHFLHATPEGLPHPTGLSMVLKPGLPDKYAGMMILAVDDFQVPANKKAQVTTRCKFNSDQPIDLFAYRTHAHDIGKRVIGLFNNKEIVNHSPQVPQQFNLFQHSLRITQNDQLDVQCNYDATHRNRVTHVGPTHLDEMCNLYYMFVSEKPALASFSCGGDDGHMTEMNDHIEDLDVKRENSLLQKNKF